MVLLSAQGMAVGGIAKVAFSSDDRVRDVIYNFNADGLTSLYPKYKGGREPRFTLPERREIKKIAKSRPAEHDLPFSTWSLSKLADFLQLSGAAMASTDAPDTGKTSTHASHSLTGAWSTGTSRTRATRRSATRRRWGHVKSVVPSIGHTFIATLGHAVVVHCRRHPGTRPADGPPDRSPSSPRG
jgi:hypothetical protein